METTTREGLMKRLYDIDCVRFGEFKLKSGLMSPIYIDLRTIISYPDFLQAISDEMWKVAKAKNLDFDTVCGVPYAALPFATLVSISSNKPMLIRRKEAKEYGTKKLIEGNIVAGQSCLIIEDVATTGSSIIETAQLLREQNLTVKYAVIIMDREQSASEKLKAAGIEMISLFTLTEILDFLSDKLDAGIVAKVREYFRSQREAAAIGEGGTADKANQDGSQLVVEPAIIRHKRATQLFDIMAQKQSNLCVSADLTSTNEILQLVQRVGADICALKLHSDIIQDFTMEFAYQLKALAEKLNFLIIEDRKFADTGSTVQLQATGGNYRFTSWVDAFTVHCLAGDGTLQALQDVCRERNIGCILVAQMSSEKNLLDEKYTQEALRMARKFNELVFGFVCQNRFVADANFVFWSPGVHIEASGDGKGQQWRTPEEAIRRDKVDVVIVGRGIISAKDVGSTASQYRQASWSART